MKILLVILPPLISLIIGIFALGHYGINWDEPYHYRRGQAYLHYYLTGRKTYEGMPKYPPLKGTSDSGDFRNSDKLFKEVQDNPSLSDPNYRRSYYQDGAWNGEYFLDIESAYGHPALNGILASLTNYIFYQKLGVLGDLEAYHLFIILTVSLATFFIAIFMWKKYGLVESLISSLVLVTYPLLVGEQHFNIKDPVEMAFYTITLLSFYLGITKSSLRWLIASVVSFGIALSVKFNIIFSIIPMAVWLIYYLYKSRPKPDLYKKIILSFSLSPLIIFAIFFVSYPTIWKAPIQELYEIARFYLGAGYEQSQPSSYYLLGFINYFPSLWITVTTPPITLILFMVPFLFAKKLLQKDSFILLLFLWFLTALLRISLFKALSYNGVRLIMEYIPAMAMLAGIGASYLIQNLKVKMQKDSSKFKIFNFLLVFSPFAFLIFNLYQIHPNENVYFNFLIGGLSGAKKANLNSWGNSYGNAYYQGVVWLNKNAQKDAKLTLPIGLIGNIPRYKLRSDIALSYNYWSGFDHKGEYVIELTYDYPQMEWFVLKYLNSAIKPIYEVKVDDVAIAKVWKNDPKYLLPEFAKERKVAAKISRKESFLEVILPQVEKIMHLSLNQPTQNCSSLKTGYLTTSLDGINWTREPEDLARDQLKHAKLKDLEEKFDFYLVARDAKYLHLYPEEINACLLNVTKAEVNVLADN